MSGKRNGGRIVYKVLFAEDEPLVRLGLQNSVPWEKYNMELTAQADNGIRAFELFLKERPDVVITDIRMEGMDGYELIQKIREIDKKCAIIVISCLDDFEIVRKLIPYKIIGYILKASMSMEEIFTVLKDTEEYLKRVGRVPQTDGENEQSPQKKIADYLLGREEELTYQEEKNICQMLYFCLEEKTGTK